MKSIQKDDIFLSFRRIFPAIWEIKETSNGIYNIIDCNAERGSSYFIEINIENNSFWAEISFENYAKELQNIVLHKLESEKSRLALLSNSFKSVRFSIQKTVSDNDFKLTFDALNTVKVSLDYRRGEAQYDLQHFFEILFSVILLIFPYYTEGEFEGEEYLDTSVKYERSKINRSICLAFHGYSCKACGIDLHQKYGEIAREFIEVHHIKPVSTAGYDRLDPINDLVPLCPNCHSIVHKRNPPITIEELKQILSNNA